MFINSYRFWARDFALSQQKRKPQSLESHTRRKVPLTQSSGERTPARDRRTWRRRGRRNATFAG